MPYLFPTSQSATSAFTSPAPALTSVSSGIVSPEDLARGIVAPARYALSYARQSVEFPEGLDRQHDENAAAAARFGYEIPNSPEFRFEDDDTSGTTKSRAGFDTMEALIESKATRACALFIRESSRIGRWNDPRRHIYYGVRFADASVPIIESNDPYVVDWDGDLTQQVTLRFLQQCLKSIHARNERIEIVTRTNRGIRDYTKQGFFVLKRPFYATERWLARIDTRERITQITMGRRESRQGHRIVLHWADDGSVQVVRDIFAWILEGRSLGWIARELTRGVIPAPSLRIDPTARPSVWHKETIRRIARNPIYCGDLLYGRTSRRFRSQAPVLAAAANLTDFGKILYLDFMSDAPISRMDFHAVQEVLDGNVATDRGRRASGSEYLLTGLLQCADCRRSLVGHRRPPNAVGVQHRYYKHTRSRGIEATCPHANRYAPAEAMEALVEGLIDDVLVDDRLEALARAQLSQLETETQTPTRARELAAAAAEVTRLERDLKESSKELLATHDEVAKGAVREARDNIVGRLKAARGTQDALKRDAERLAAVADQITQQPERLADLRAVYAQATPVARSRVRHSILHRVAVDFAAARIEIAVRATPARIVAA